MKSKNKYRILDGVKVMYEEEEYVFLNCFVGDRYQKMKKNIYKTFILFIY